MESQESFQHWFSRPVLRLRRSVPDVAVADQVAVVVDPLQRAPGLRAPTPRPARRRRSTARTRRAGSRTAGWRRRSRSTASAAAPRTRRSRRTAARAGSCPGSSSRKSSSRVPCSAAEQPQRGARPARARTAATCKQVKMLSRPNMVMNQGSPAAGSACPLRDIGAKRSAARSTRLRRYVVCSGSQSVSSCGACAEPLVQVRLHRPPGAACRPARARSPTGRRRARAPPPARGSSVVHCCVGFDADGEREPVLVDFGGLAKR